MKYREDLIRTISESAESMQAVCGDVHGNPVVAAPLKRLRAVLPGSSWADFRDR